MHIIVILLHLVACFSCSAGDICQIIDCPAVGSHLSVTDREGYEVYSCSITNDCELADSTKPSTRVLNVPVDKPGNYKCSARGLGIGSHRPFKWTHLQTTACFSCSAGDICQIDCPAVGSHLSVTDREGYELHSCEVRNKTCKLANTTKPETRILNVHVGRPGAYKCSASGDGLGNSFKWSLVYIQTTEPTSPTPGGPEIQIDFQTSYIPSAAVSNPTPTNNGPTKTQPPQNIGGGQNTVWMIIGVCLLVAGLILAAIVVRIVYNRKHKCLHKKLAAQTGELQTIM